MPLITLGSASSLIIKIPSAGDTNWATDFQNEFASKIATHDHTEGKGSRITTAAIEDRAVTSDKVALNSIDTTHLVDLYINDLADVDTNTNPPLAGEYLQWDGSNWLPADITVETADIVNDQNDAIAYDSLSQNLRKPILLVGAGTPLYFDSQMNAKLIIVTGVPTGKATFKANVQGCTIVSCRATSSAQLTDIGPELNFYTDVSLGNRWVNQSTIYGGNVSFELQGSSGSSGYYDIQFCDIKANDITFKGGSAGANPGVYHRVHNSNLIGFENIKGNSTGGRVEFNDSFIKTKQLDYGYFNFILSELKFSTAGTLLTRLENDGTTIADNSVELVEMRNLSPLNFSMSQNEQLKFEKVYTLPINQTMGSTTANVATTFLEVGGDFQVSVSIDATNLQGAVPVVKVTPPTGTPSFQTMAVSGTTAYATLSPIVQGRGTIDVDVINGLSGISLGGQVIIKKI